MQDVQDQTCPDAEYFDTIAECHPSVLAQLRFFHRDFADPVHQAIQHNFRIPAYDMVMRYPRSPETTEGLKHLRAAMHCAIDATVPPIP